MMCHGENSKLLCGDMINNAIWESTEDKSPASATKHSTEQRVVQNEIGRSFNLSHKRETKLDIRLQRIKRCRVVQFGERRWSNYEPHFSAART
jgi:hypothetical protein